MSKASRLFDLMQILRRHHHPVAGSGLAREARVSLRTIYRDIATLQAMGAAIEGEAGVGYILRPGFLLPPLMFSEEELQALALGAQWVRTQTDEGLALAAHDALSKIGAVLPPELRYVLNDNDFHVGRPSAQARSVDLKMLRQAMREQRKLLITYRDPKGVETERVIWPIGIAFFESRRIIAGWCELRQDFRPFRTDRIERAELQTDRYPGRRRDLVKKWRSQVDETRRSPLADGR
jgi:predicted DNA-binding transcriptional regulator YafY